MDTPVPDISRLAQTLDTMVADGVLADDEAALCKLALQLVRRTHDFLDAMNQQEPAIETVRFRLVERLELQELVFSFCCRAGVWISHEDLEGDDWERAQDMLVDLNSLLLGLGTMRRNACLAKAFSVQGERYAYRHGHLIEHLQASMGQDGWAYHEKLGLEQHTPPAAGSPGRGRRL